MTILKTSYLKAGYGPLEEALRRTEAGMADFVDLASLHNCSQCAHWHAIKGKDGQGRCALFTAFMRGHRKKAAMPRPLRAAQQACRKWASDLGRPDGEPAPTGGAGVSSPDWQPR